VVFTLESEGRVVGRKVLPVRVCTCPKRDRQHDEKERGAGSSSGRTPGDKRAPPDPRETLVQSQSQEAAGEVQQPSTSGVADEFWVLARGAENYKALRQMAEVLEKHRGGDLEEWERKQEEGKKRRRV
jgi:hypothetical protein